MGIMKGGEKVKGRIEIEGREIYGIREEKIRKIRGRDIEMVYKKKISEIKKVWKVGEKIEEDVMENGMEKSKEEGKREIEMIGRVGIKGKERV